MSLLSYNSCYIRVKRLFSLLYNYVQQHILNTHSLLLMVDQNINNVALLPNNGSLSISISHYYLLNCKCRIIWSSFQKFMQHCFGLKINKEQLIMVGNK